MKKISELRKFYQLKSVYREAPVGDRKESSAEHTWSCLILADYFMSKIKLDRLKVYELLLYHDVVEIEAGDIPIHHEAERNNKKEAERKAMEKLKEELPQELRPKLSQLFKEFEESSSTEARFARAIDRIDAVIHELDYKKHWKGWSEAQLRKYNEEAIKDFPEIKEFFEEVVKFVNKEGYFDQ
ncbi:MAG: HD domain-containing protein [Candidatus Woesearchaeota archaeon]